MKKYPDEIMRDVWIMGEHDTVRVPIPLADPTKDYIEITIADDGAVRIRSVNGALVIRPEISNSLRVYRTGLSAKSLYYHEVSEGNE